MDKSLESNKIKFLDLTHKLNDYNEIYNVNTYLQGAYGLELERLLESNNELKTHLLRMKQEYMTNESGINAYRFRTNIVYFTIFVICIILMITASFAQTPPKLSARMLFIICAVIIVVYFIIVLIMIKSNNERRYYAYNQFYWYPIKPKVEASAF